MQIKDGRAKVKLFLCFDFSVQVRICEQRFECSLSAEQRFFGTSSLRRVVYNLQSDSTRVPLVRRFIKNHRVLTIKPLNSWISNKYMLLVTLFFITCKTNIIQRLTDYTKVRFAALIKKKLSNELVDCRIAMSIKSKKVKFLTRNLACLI